MVQKFLAKYPDYSEAEIKQKALDCKAQVWCATRGEDVIAVAVTTVEKTDVNKFVLVWLCAGESMGEWLYAIEAIEAWARSIACSEVRVYGREGWQRALPGYEKKFVALAKRL